MVALGNACSAIDVLLGDSTFNVAIGDATGVMTLENPLAVFSALDTSTTGGGTIEDCTTGILPKKCD